MTDHTLKPGKVIENFESLIYPEEETTPLMTENDSEAEGKPKLTQSEFVSSDSGPTDLTKKSIRPVQKIFRS